MATLKSIKEVAEATGMSQYAIRRGISAGLYPAFRAGGNPNGKYLINIELFILTLNNMANGNITAKDKTASHQTITRIRKIAE